MARRRADHSVIYRVSWRLSEFGAVLAVTLWDEAQDRSVGSAHCSMQQGESCWWISSVHVRESWRNRGYGTQLLRAVERFAWRKLSWPIQLAVSGFGDMSPSRLWSWYRSRGYERVGENCSRAVRTPPQKFIQRTTPRPGLMPRRERRVTRFYTTSWRWLRDK